MKDGIVKDELLFWQTWFDTHQPPEQYIKLRQQALLNITSSCPTILTQKDQQGLDLGCGLVSVYEQSEFKHITAIDPIMHEYDKIYKLDAPTVQYMHNHTNNGLINFPDNTFDFISCVNMIDHTDYYKQLIKEMYRVIKPNGYLYLHVNLEHTLNFPQHRTLWDYNDVRVNFSMFLMRQARIFWWEEPRKYVFWGTFIKE